MQYQPGKAVPVQVHYSRVRMLLTHVRAFALGVIHRGWHAMAGYAQEAVRKLHSPCHFRKLCEEPPPQQPQVGLPDVAVGALVRRRAQQRGDLQARRMYASVKRGAAQHVLFAERERHRLQAPETNEAPRRMYASVKRGECSTRCRCSAGIASRR